MDTLLDYVKWMEDFDFETVPLRDADILIMCLLAYFDLAPGYVSEMIPRADSGEVRLHITGGDMGNRDVFNAAVHSKRFGSLKVTDCVDILKEDPPLQFAAMTFRCDQFTLVAFRGTDSSLAGWKENFMISFTRTRAQELAAEYANQIIAAADGPCYVAGHSKGGNLALYAGCQLTDENLRKTEHIFTLDGPGLCPEVIDPSLIRRIDSKTTFVNPEFDVIGKLFEPKLTKVLIIKSFRDGFAQHSLPSWLIDHGKLTSVPTNAPASIRLNQIIDEWVADKSPEVREHFVDELFEAIREKGVDDFENMKFESLVDIMISLRSASDTTKDMLRELQHKLLSPEDILRPTLEKAKNNFNEFKNTLEQAVKKHQREDN